MRKPDFPEGIWDDAENTLDTMLSNQGYEGWRDDSIEAIAHAITAAVAKEREACAGAAYIGLQGYVTALNLGAEPESVTFLQLKDTIAAIRERSKLALNRGET